MFEYLLLGLLASGVSLSTIDSSYVKPRVGFEGRYFFDNSLPAFNNKGMELPKDKAKSYIRVHSQYTVLGVLDLNVAMQGWASEQGFTGNGSRGGGIWGTTIRLSDNFSIGYEHFSCHNFNSANTCGSMDAMVFNFQIGYDGQGYKSLLGEIVKWW